MPNDDAGRPSTPIDDQLERASIEDVLRMQDQLARFVRERYERALAVLFSDIAGSTAYFERHGDAAGRRMIQRHHDLLIPVVERGGGRIVKTIGDALMATFPTAQAAVDAAVQMQRAVSRDNLRATHDSETLDIRIGINFGTALVNDKDGDVYGDMVNVAARVQAQAQRRQILISETVRDALSSAVRLRDAGRFTLKGKSQPFVLHEVAWADSPAPDLPRPKVDSRYSVVEPLGQGGMASVWRARDERLGRDVALKVVHPHLPLSTSARERFRREAQTAAALTHDNVVQTYDYGAAEGSSSYIAMELVDGQTLRAWMDAHGAMPSAAAALVGHEVARALAYAHDKGVIHRDVKPDNVLVSKAGAVKLGDFGIAVVGESVRLTAQAGQVVGTPGYVAPEQLRGAPPDPRTDLFALGVLLYELVTARPPFPGDSPQAVIFRVAEGTFVRVDDVQEGVEPELIELIHRCLARDPLERPQRAHEVAERLAELLRAWGAGDPRAAIARYFAQGVVPDRRTMPLPLREPALAPKRRTGKVAVTIAAVALLGAAGAVVSLRERTVAPAASPTTAASQAPREAAPAPKPTAVAAPDLPVEPPPSFDEEPPVPVDATLPSTGGRAGPPPIAEELRPAAPVVVSPGAAPKKRTAARQGTLVIVVRGGWAEIHVDGMYVGTAPQVTRVPLPAGTHRVQLLNRYKQPYETKVAIRAGATSELQAVLQPLPEGP